MLFLMVSGGVFSPCDPKESGDDSTCQVSCSIRYWMCAGLTRPSSSSAALLYCRRRDTVSGGAFRGEGRFRPRRIDPSSAQGTPLTYEELIVASEEHDSEEQYHADRILRDHEEELDEFEDSPRIMELV